MTAYVYTTFVLEHGTLSIEISSVNRRHLDVNSNLPTELSRLDPDIRKAVAAKNSRGNVSVRISLSLSDYAPVMVKPNLPLVRQFATAWRAISSELGLAGDRQFDLSLLKGEVGIFSYENTLSNDDAFCIEVMTLFEKALDELAVMKLKEGQALHKDIEERLKLLKELIEVIESKRNGATERYRERLIERLQEVIPGAFENEERILREICIYAEKIDITEELIRFRSHVDQFEKTMRNCSGGVGKKLEFLIQEMLREVNTIASKSSDIAVSHATVDMKGELEKIREQLQNIE